jgi:hypothetical protein
MGWGGAGARSTACCIRATAGRTVGLAVHGRLAISVVPPPELPPRTDKQSRLSSQRWEVEQRRQKSACSFGCARLPSKAGLHGRACRFWQLRTRSGGSARLKSTAAGCTQCGCRRSVSAIAGSLALQRRSHPRSLTPVDTTCVSGADFARTICHSGVQVLAMCISLQSACV